MLNPDPNEYFLVCAHCADEIKTFLVSHALQTAVAQRRVVFLHSFRLPEMGATCFTKIRKPLESGTT